MRWFKVHFLWHLVEVCFGTKACSSRLRTYLSTSLPILTIYTSIDLLMDLPTYTLYIHAYLSLSLSIYIYIYIYVCVCVFVFAPQ